MAICLVIGGFLGWSLKPVKKCPEIIGTVTEYKEVPVKHDSLIYVPKVISKLQKVNVDSIYYAAKKYWEQFYDNSAPIDYVAETDTTLNDSLINGKIGFVSRIPIDPNGFFNIDLNVRERIITNTIIETEEVYMPRRLAFGFGVVASLSNPVVAKVLGNVTYKPIDTEWFEMPFTTEVQYDDKLEFNFRVEGKIKF